MSILKTTSTRAVQDNREFRRIELWVDNDLLTTYDHLKKKNGHKSRHAVLSEILIAFVETDPEAKRVFCALIDQPIDKPIDRQKFLIDLKAGRPATKEIRKRKPAKK